jgi:hypothetical protein
MRVPQQRGGHCCLRASQTSRRGWARDDTAHAVFWPVGQHTWATVAGVDTTNEALALARDLRFVDEDTWRATSVVDAPTFAPAGIDPATDDTVTATTAAGNPPPGWGDPTQQGTLEDIDASTKHVVGTNGGTVTLMLTEATQPPVICS